MKKIPSIFIKDPKNLRHATREINPLCQWVFDGEGVAYRKYDGTSCMIKDGIYYKRRTIKRGKKIPEDFIEETYDPNTNKRFGWVLVTLADIFHLKGWENSSTVDDGTYELVGPRIQGGIENFGHYLLIKHDECESYPDIPLEYDAMAEWFKGKRIEGVVFHHPDGRKGKIKKKDFGLALDA